MLPETINPQISVLDNDLLQVNLGRWMQQCELIKSYYSATHVFVLQITQSGFEVIVSSVSETPLFTSGTLFPNNFPLFEALKNSNIDGDYLNLSRFMLDELPRDFDGIQYILSRPIAWPDGSQFGSLCVLNPHMADPLSNSAMLEPFQILLQQELSLLCQNHRIESLSMRDQETGMLNHYGFMMMAPRQLNLGRRFGAHAGILFFELIEADSPEKRLEEKHHRLLGNLVQDTIRTADVAAHFSATQFVVLAFVDSERDILHIMKRVEKQLEQQNHHLKLDSSYSFFTPESTAKLAPMMEDARCKLKSMLQESTQSSSNQAKGINAELYNNPAADSAEL
ncbi:GGDEF domain-containing protein [Shewanella xiamenensis]|uniref:GGDEF domain-containing protein n=1 Tax=Shewanella TaxID=22 RepID=UPI0006DA53A5|nr:MULTISPECIES: GGDEF domain-containing protein [Shewanella]KPN77528.1 deoxycytidine triphosphate deaminase [Shewanella sp. Sh95]BDQ67502.1 GGDEF domain-containing protein [Shewanella xiamenensis]GLD78195.1 GGDEF domain-containing protein [Shewanella xiamenensis]